MRKEREIKQRIKIFKQALGLELQKKPSEHKSEYIYWLDTCIQVLKWALKEV